MRIDFDPGKNQRNRIEHGISLGEASCIDWDRALKWPDERHAYGEERIRAIGHIGNRLYHVVYVIRGNRRRIISLRKANSRGVKLYEQSKRNHLPDS
jgi:uncharacterized DUF497 family protein